MNINYIDLEKINPYIRYVNNYAPNYFYRQRERIIYDYELMYVMDGHMQLHYGKGIYELHKGDIFIMKPGVVNHMEIKADDHFRTHCIHFDWVAPEEENNFSAVEFYELFVLPEALFERASQLIQRPLFEPKNFDLPCHIVGMPYDKMSSLFAKSYYEYIKNTPISKMRVISIFYQIIAEMLYYNSGADSGVTIHPQIANAANYIKTHYSRKLTVAGLADKYGLSPKYFGRLFKESFGCNINEYILDVRLFAAKEMLIGSEMSIDEISAETGFSDSFYFSRCFKNREKMPPSKYRSKMIKNQMHFFKNK